MLDDIATLMIVGVLLLAAVAAIIIFVRTQWIDRLDRRMQQLDARLRRLEATREQPAENQPIAPTATLGPALPSVSAQAPAPQSAPRPRPIDRAPAARPARPAIDWELFIGRRALGWAAVVVLLFAAAFFVKYAFDNQWLGPTGRVSLGLAAGVALVAVGWREYRRGWKRFSQMPTAGGIVLLYLSAFGAFGFYHLLDQRAAGVFLSIIVVESALLALFYDAWAIALMAVIGGLLAPVLLQTEQDQYQALFLYLALLNAGVVGLLLRRRWPAVGTVALLGTQLLFWAWRAANYHPDKLAWALGFQLAIFALYLGHTIAANVIARRAASWEEIARLLLNAALWFLAAHALLHDDFADWSSSLALLMAAVYAGVARGAFARRAAARLPAACIAASAGFLALAFPLQADTPWVAVGWAAEAAVLWWFGLRIDADPLRIMGLAMAVLTALRIAGDAQMSPAEPSWLVLNRFALPALSATFILLAGLVAGRRLMRRAAEAERVLAALGGVICLLLLMAIESLDLTHFFDSRGYQERMVGMSLSAWWSVYATALLVIGFAAAAPLLRWTALGIYAVTIAKVFLIDMAGLNELYRIAAFFVLAVLLGAAAWLYQRLNPEQPAADRSSAKSIQSQKSSQEV